MSARVESEVAYSWWCDECDSGSETFDSESYADSSADAHDDMFHPESVDDRSDA